MTTTTKPEWMLSTNAIARRMRNESEKRGARGLVYTLHTESCFALENVRLGHTDIARAENMRQARRAFRRLTRDEGDKIAPKGLEKALAAYFAANAATR